MVSVEADASTSLVEPLPDAVLREERWKLVVRGAWLYDGTIHDKEGRVALMSVRHASRSLAFSRAKDPHDRRQHG